MRVVTTETEGGVLYCQECDSHVDALVRLGVDDCFWEVCAACIARAGEMIREVGK